MSSQKTFLGFLIIVFAALLAGSAAFYFNGPALDNEKAASGWRLYRDDAGKFQFQYPAGLSLSESEGGAVVVGHRVPYVHADPCDFRDGDHTLNDFVDFNMTLRISEKSLEDTMRDTQGKGILLSDYLDAGSFKVSGGFITPVTIGGLGGHQVSLGAEGCGILYYYFPFPNGSWLVVTRPVTPHLTELNPNRDQFSKIPGVISLERAESTFQEILSTFKLL